MSLRAILASSALLLLPSLGAQSRPQEPIEILNSAPPDRQRAAASRLLAELGKDDAQRTLLESCRIAATAIAVGASAVLPPDRQGQDKAASSKPAVQRSRPKPAVKKAPRLVDEAQLDRTSLPCRLEYCFATRVVVAGDHIGTKEPRTPKSSQQADAETAEPIVLHHALLGCVPDADKLLAWLLCQLDADEGAAEFSMFLLGWRNEQESFYEALDRTAGTNDSLFYYDAMLHDYTGRFAKGNRGKALKQDFKSAHDALHDSFLSLRQYRGFREAVAWSLVLPPTTALPRRLQRYEDKVAGAYSLREQVLMVAECLDHDLRQIVSMALANAPRMPDPLWSQPYDPYPAWSATFLGLQDKMIDSAGSTDAMLERAKSRRTKLAESLRSIAIREIEGIQPAKSKAH